MATDCETPWYKAYSFVCATSGMLTGGAAGGALGYQLAPAGLGAASTAAGIGAGLGIGFFLGFCGCRISGRLKKNPDEPVVSIPGYLASTGRNTGVMPFNDGDWLFNIIPCRNERIMKEAYDGTEACVRRFDDGTAYLHCEISSAIGNAGCVGSMIGSIIGGVAGAAAGLAVAAIIAASCAAWGPFAWLCLIVAAIVAAIIALVGAVGGGLVGGVLGSGVGAVIDEITEPDDIADGVSAGTCVIVTGEWVTDLDHGWNELHELRSIEVIEHYGEAGESAEDRKLHARRCCDGTLAFHAGRPK